MKRFLCLLAVFAVSLCLMISISSVAMATTVEGGSGTAIGMLTFGNDVALLVHHGDDTDKGAGSSRENGKSQPTVVAGCLEVQPVLLYQKDGGRQDPTDI